MTGQNAADKPAAEGHGHVEKAVEEDQSTLPAAGRVSPPSSHDSASVPKGGEAVTNRQTHEQSGLPTVERAKQQAAYRAVDAHVKPHHRVIGIGSGSTVPYVVERILQAGKEANKDRWARLLKYATCLPLLIHILCSQFIPTGFQSKELIVHAGLKLGDVDQFPSIDVTIDGADDVDTALNAIKGGGAKFE